MDINIKQEIVKQLANISLTLFLCLALYSTIVQSIVLFATGIACLLLYFYFENKAFHILKEGLCDITN